MLLIYCQSDVGLLLFSKLDFILMVQSTLIKCLKHANTHITLRQSVYCWTWVSRVNHGSVMIVIG